MAVAEAFWGMPPDAAEDRALLALPVHPTLALLRPRRPAWFPGRTEFDGDDDEAIGGAIRSLVERVQLERPDDELMAFSSPILMSMERCVEVSVVLWAQAEGGSVADEGLAEHLKDLWKTGELLASEFQEPLGTTTIVKSPALHEIVDQDSKTWPLAKQLDFNRLGYLQHDLYPGRLFLPTMPGHGQLEVKPCGGGLEVKSGSEVVADLCYWNAGWGQVRPMQLDGNCGMALISKGTAYRISPDDAVQKVRAFYFWRVRTLHRKDGFNGFEENLSFGATFV